jgi:hypothetical protein
MRGVTGGVVAGAVALLALDVFAPPVGLGLGISAWPAIGTDESAAQSVDRTHKADRLLPRDAVGPAPAAPTNASAGCELPFSPLSRSAQGGDFARRCIAQIGWRRSAG